MPKIVQTLVFKYDMRKKINLNKSNDVIRDLYNNEFRIYKFAKEKTLNQ